MKVNNRRRNKYVPTTPVKEFQKEVLKMMIESKTEPEDTALLSSKAYSVLSARALQNQGNIVVSPLLEPNENFLLKTS